MSSDLISYLIVGMLVWLCPPVHKGMLLALMSDDGDIANKVAAVMVTLMTIVLWPVFVASVLVTGIAAATQRRKRQ